MKFIFTLLSICFAVISVAQEATVNGQCVDKSGRGLEDVKVFYNRNSEDVVYTNADGYFSIQIPINREVVLFASAQGQELKESFNLKNGQVYELGKWKFSFQQTVGVNVVGQGTGNEVIDMDPKDLVSIPLAENVQQTLKYLTPATSSNELSSNYNVRGGNYDENLVYVNGFKIYRPFLTRSGQQEGMGFIYTPMVEKIKFSAGGFESHYGDKLSSVLDIKYRTPDSLQGSASASLLGVEAHIESAVNSRFGFLAGARYRSNGYLLNALPTKGAYNPVFFDFQLVTNYAITENLMWETIGHFSSNNYRFTPQSQETKFGTVNQALSFKVFFEGQEQTKFVTATGATSLKWKKSKRTQLDFYASVFNTDEKEYFDILGQYFINELEKDPSKEEFGDSIATLGIGSFLNHGRNNLKATIYNVYHRGTHKFLKLDSSGYNYIDRGHLNWGASIQFEDFYDVLSEWKLIDSAGYSIPQGNDSEIQLFETIKAKNTLQTFRTDGFLEFQNEKIKKRKNYFVKLKQKTRDENGNKQKSYFYDTIDVAASKFGYNIGVRGGYTDFNGESWLTPRASVQFYPIRYYRRDSVTKRRFIRMRLATGLYYQPPFLRELRTFDGQLNLDIKSQKSAHIVAGIDTDFEMWERKSPFKFTAEAYYKYLWDVNPYEIDNVRTRYYTTNDAVAYAYGFDLNLHGEFIKGMQSYFKLGMLRTKEDFLSDEYYIYLNSDGDTIRPGFTFNDVATDSIQQLPGYISRPSDQLFNFATYFQDRMPGFERLSVQLGLIYGSPLPFGPPDFKRYKDVLRQRSYFRVDIGFGYDFLYNKKKEQRNNFGKRFEDIRLNFEIFNLLGINNTLNYQWVQDTGGTYYAIPNFLTSRRFNLKLIIRW